MSWVSLLQGAVPIFCMPAWGCPCARRQWEGHREGCSVTLPSGWRCSGLVVSLLWGIRHWPDHASVFSQAAEEAARAGSQQGPLACTGAEQLSTGWFFLFQMQSRAAALGQASAQTRRTANPSRWVSSAIRAQARGQGTSKPVLRVAVVEAVSLDRSNAPCTCSSFKLLWFPPAPASHCLAPE